LAKNVAARRITLVTSMGPSSLGSVSRPSTSHRKRKGAIVRRPEHDAGATPPSPFVGKRSEESP
jgi:hypothetical protein